MHWFVLIVAVIASDLQSEKQASMRLFTETTAKLSVSQLFALAGGDLAATVTTERIDGYTQYSIAGT
jgi:hypothetical protein